MTSLPVSSTLPDLLSGGPYQGYTYGYPHKTAYRAFESPLPLREVWAGEDKSSLFLYLHIPFCEMRCGFCNLFTTVNAPVSLEQGYLDATERQAEVVADALGDATFSRMAIGGGTPTYLEVGDLERVFDLLERSFGASAARLPTSVETSPATATPERLELLRERGVERVSIGVQSFTESEVHSVGRAQQHKQVVTALDAIRAAGLPVLSIDLIYGLAHQTPDTWLDSLRTALTWAPEELFLYPLYVRPLTGIGRLGRTWDDERLELYRLGRDFLLASGYLQTSMRCFQLASQPIAVEPEYTCKTGGMVGLGCGARSYTQALHYSSEYAVGAVGVREIIQDFVARPAERFGYVSHGIRLNTDEQRRRFVLQSMLNIVGLDVGMYRQAFGSDPHGDFPQLAELEAAGLAFQQSGILRLTPAGLEQSDALGPWLYSPVMVRLSEEYAWR